MGIGKCKRQMAWSASGSAAGEACSTAGRQRSVDYGKDRPDARRAIPDEGGISARFDGPLDK
jgi:hypothetical protein